MGEIVKANFDPSATLSVLSKTDEYLQHYGINGMKWGARNGPPYPLNNSQRTAKERKLNPVSEAIKVYQEKAKKKKAEAAKVAQVKKQEAEEEKKALEEKKKAEAEEWKKKRNYKALSDDELRSYIARAKLEAEYVKMVLPPEKESMMKKLAIDAGKGLGSFVLTKALPGGAKFIAKKVFGIDKDAGPNAWKKFEEAGEDPNKLDDKTLDALSKRIGNNKKVEQYKKEKEKKESEADPIETIIADIVSELKKKKEKKTSTYSFLDDLEDMDFPDWSASLQPEPKSKKEKKTSTYSFLDDLENMDFPDWSASSQPGSKPVKEYDISDYIDDMEFIEWSTIKPNDPNTIGGTA